MKDSQDGGGAGGRGRGPGIGGGGKGGVADRGVMAAPPYGRVGGVPPPPPWVARSAPRNPEFSRDAAARAQARQCPAAAVGRREGWNRVALAFVPRLVPALPCPSALFLSTTLAPQHRHWRVWAKPPSFRLRWRNVPGTRRNGRTGVGLYDNRKKEGGG